MEGTYLAWIDVRDLALDNPGKYFESFGLGLSDGRRFRRARFRPLQLRLLPGAARTRARPLPAGNASSGRHMTSGCSAPTLQVPTAAFPQSIDVRHQIRIGPFRIGQIRIGPFRIGPFRFEEKGSSPDRVYKSKSAVELLETLK